MRVPRSSSIEPGLLVLASLLGGPKHGYAIIQDIAVHTGRRLGAGTLYGIIARLEKSGFIRPLEMEDRGRRPYRVTPAGKREFQDQMKALQQYHRALRELATI